jgi:FixJ family two-component response regulator
MSIQGLQTPHDGVAEQLLPIAVVDDDLDFRESVVALLAGQGLPTIEFSSGTAFVESAAWSRVRCVVLDVRLGDMSGLEVLRRIDAVDAHCAPIIVVSGHADVPTAVTAMKHRNVLDLLEKPFAPDMFLGMVRRALDLDHRLRGELAFRDEFAAKLERLSPREREVLDLLAAGETNKAISVQLDLSPKTVATHRANLLEKFGVASILDVACPLRRLRTANPTAANPTVAVTQDR